MQQLNPKAVWLFFIGLLVRWFLVFIFFSFWLSTLIAGIINYGNENSFGFLIWLLPIIPFFLIFLWIWAKLSYRYYRYELREDGFRKELGVIMKKYVTIPYGRIQNVDIYRGLTARILGLSDLNIQTAGSSGKIQAEGRLPGLSHEVAEQLRDELIRRSRKSSTANQGL